MAVNSTTPAVPIGGLPSGFCPLDLAAGECACDAAAGLCTVSVPYVVPSGRGLVVPANGRFLFADTLTVGTGARLTVEINSAPAVPIPVTVAGSFAMGGTLELRTGSGTPSPGRSAREIPARVVVVAYGSPAGTLAVEARSTDSCTVVTAIPTFQSTFMAVDLSAAQMCTHLTQGAVIAIAVFSALGFIAIVLVVAAICVRSRRRRNAASHAGDSELAHY
jgi:hypothetical protein